MKSIEKAGIILLVAALVSVAALTAAPLSADDSGTTPVQVTVTVSGESNRALPELTPQDVLVFQNSHRRPIVGWKAVSADAAGRDLVILIDSSLGTRVTLQFSDLRSFVRSLPASTEVGIAYAQDGSAQFKQEFTTDREKAEAALQVPEGSIEAGASVFESVSDLAKHWPADGRTREVLLVSNGVDYNRGVSETDPTLSPDLDEAINQAQKAGLSIYTIYAGGASKVTRDTFLLDNGQSSLTRLASETGGEAYFQGLSTPVSFAPFLDQLRAALGRQYLLTFQAAVTGKPNYSRLKVTIETPHVRVKAPARVWVPKA